MRLPRSVIAVVAAAVVVLCPVAASAFTIGDIRTALGDRNVAASEALITAFREKGPQSNEAVEALAALRATTVTGRTNVAALVPDNDVQRRYLEVVDSGLGRAIALIDRFAAGTIDANEFVSQTNALSTRLPGEIENAAGTGGSTRTAAPSGGDSGLPFPLNQWWFWVFIAPEVVFFAGWVIFMVFSGIGFGGAWAFRKARGENGSAAEAEVVINTGQSDPQRVAAVGTCAWLITNRATGETRYCKRAPLAGAPYCHQHAAKAMRL